MLLYQDEQATQEIFNTNPETGDDFATAMEKLDNYFTPKKKKTYEIFQFRKADQQSGETADQFATRLRKLASTCEFTDLAKELKSIITQNFQSKRLRRVAPREIYLWMLYSTKQDCKKQVRSKQKELNSCYRHQKQ